MKGLMTLGAIAGSLVLVVPGVLVMPGVAHAQYGEDEGDIQVDDSTPEPGDDINISSPANTWQNNSEVNATLFSAPIELGTFTAGTDGSLQATITIPEDVEPGEHTLQLAGTGPDGNPKTVQTTLNVGGDAAAGEELAATGSSGVGDMLRTSALVIVVGLTLVALAVSRQRKRTERSADQETAGV